MLRPLVAAAVVSTLAWPAWAAADSKGKGKNKDKAKGQAPVTVVFTDRDREAARGYWVEAYGRGNCPPGLAKKHNGCLPPGQAKKRYVIGHPLPAGVVVQPVPPVLVTRLGRPPAGYEYVLVDGDLVKLAVGTRLVIDAISALVD
jgi:Ni/Co efflux regulator RcnB